MKRIIAAGERHSGIEEVISTVKDADYEIAQVENFQGLIQAVKKADAVIIDTALPGLDDLPGLVRKLSSEKGVPVVLYGLKEDDPEAGAALAMGAVDYMVYPVRKERLLSVIGTIFGEEGEGHVPSRGGRSVVERMKENLRNRHRAENMVTLLKFVSNASVEMFSSSGRNGVTGIIAMLSESLGWRKGAVLLRDEKLGATNIQAWGIPDEEMKVLRKEMESPEIWRRRLSKEYDVFREGRGKWSGEVEFYFLPVERRAELEGFKPPEGDRNRVPGRWMQGDIAYAPLRDRDRNVLAILYLIEPVNSANPVGQDEEGILPLEIMIKSASTALQAQKEHEELKLSRNRSNFLYEELMEMSLTSIELFQSGNVRRVLETITESAKRQGWGRSFAFITDRRFPVNLIAETGFTPEECRITSEISKRELWVDRFGEKFEDYRIGDFYYIPWLDERARTLMGFSAEGEDTAPAAEGWHPNDFIYAPLKASNGDILGVVVLDSPESERKPGKMELEPLSILLRVAGEVIERIIYEKDIRIRTEIVQAIGDSAVAEGKLREVIESFLGRLCSLLSMDSAAVVFYDREEGEFRPLASSGLQERMLEMKNSITAQLGGYYPVAEYVKKTGKPLIIPDISSVRPPSEIALYTEIVGAKSLLAFPMKGRDGLLSGTLQLVSMEPIKLPEFGKEFLRHSIEMFALFIERRMMEGETSRLIESLMDIVFKTDRDGIIRFITPSVAGTVGASPDKMIGTNIVDYAVPEDRKKLRDALRECVLKGKAFQNVEVRFNNQNGAVVYISLNLRPISGEEKFSGTPDFNDIRVRGIPDREILGVMRDITPLVKSRKELTYRERILQAVGEAGKILQKDESSDDFQRALTILGRATGVSRAYLFENRASGDGRTFTSQRFEWCAEGIEPQIDNPELQDADMEAAGFGRWLGVLERKKLIYGQVSDFPESEQPLLQSQGIKSILIAPLTVDGQFRGFIGFDDTEKEREWRGVERRALATAASFFASRMGRDERLERIRELNSLFWTIIESEKVISEEAEAGNMFERVCKILSKFRDYPAVWVEEKSEKTGKGQIVRVSAGKEANVIELLRGQADEKWISGKVSLSGQIQILENPARTHIPEAGKKALLERGINAALSVPVSWNDRVFGSLNVLSRHGIMHEESHLLEEIGKALGCAVYLKRIKGGGKNDEH